MARSDVHREMKEMFGTVISFVDLIPDDFIDAEWDLMKRVQFAETKIPNKYKELIGIGVSAATKCRYCILFHTEAARLNGATDAEIEEAVHYTKTVVGWSTYLNGMQVDYDAFKTELQGVVAHLTGASVAA